MEKLPHPDVYIFSLLSLSVQNVSIIWLDIRTGKIIIITDAISILSEVFVFIITAKMSKKLNAGF